jgi:hypothetical protein
MQIRVNHRTVGPNPQNRRLTYKSGYISIINFSCMHDIILARITGMDLPRMPPEELHVLMHPLAEWECEELERVMKKRVEAVRQGRLN